MVKKHNWIRWNNAVLIIVIKLLILSFPAFTFPDSAEAEWTIEVQSPASGTEIPDEFLVCASIKIGERMITYYEGLSWTSAVLMKKSGGEILRIILQDNGQNSDLKAHDGFWTSPWPLKVAPGEYSLFIIVKAEDGALSESERTYFSVVEAPPKEEKMTTPPNIELISAIDNVANLITTENNALKSDLASFKSWLYIIVLFILLILTISIIHLLLKPAAGKKGMDKPAITGEQWGPVLRTLENIGKLTVEAEKSISSTYNIHFNISEQLNRLRGDVLDIFDFARSWTEAPKEYIEPFRAKLTEALEHQGIEEWSPEIGKPAPDGCKKLPAVKASPYSLGEVAEVVAPGHRIVEGGEYKIVKSPVVYVVTNKTLKES